jgi:hypothetical protein
MNIKKQGSVLSTGSSIHGGLETLIPADKGGGGLLYFDYVRPYMHFYMYPTHLQNIH